MDPFENSEPIKFTNLLRDKLRSQRGLLPQQVDTLSQLKLITKRNVEVKRSYELSKEGIVVDPCFFEPETTLMRRCRLAKDANLNHLYEDFGKETHRLSHLRMKQDANLARHWKYLNQESRLSTLPKALDKDFYSWKVDFDKKGEKFAEELKFFMKQLNDKKKLMAQADQKKDLLEENGFAPLSEKTFDGLFMKGWQVEGEESSEEELVTAPEPSHAQSSNKSVFDSDQDIEESLQQQPYFEEESNFSVEQAEPLLDLSMIDPSKVNWFKYIVDKYLNEEADSSILNSTDAYANLLQIVLSAKKNEEIQDELLDLVGFDNFELLSQLIDKREFIREYCGQISEKLNSEKAKDDAYKNKNFDMPRGNVGVSVTFQKGTKGKKQKGSVQQYEMSKGSNYDLLIALGFDKSLIAENKRLGLKERTMQNLNRYVLEHAQDMKDGNVEIDHTKEQKAQIYANQLANGDKSKIKQEENDDWKWVEITPPPKPPQDKKNLICVKEKMPKFCHQAFGTATHLNQIQTIVHPVAFLQARSILIAAPTGAGKTNIALMTILREIAQHLGDKANQGTSWSVKEKEFKVIYIAPLKALAAEIVGKFQTALSYLGVQVRELTGDMGLTKQEMTETHVIVATPEKWDVVTRKTDGMMSLVNVLIIDEIHLLNDPRGLVIECLVARAISTGMKMQKPIRIVGLSATLPNYTDVADFIGADGQGTFAFDASYRPTPLKCSFYGIKEMGNAQRGNNIMNEIIFENLIRILKMGKQIIIFMHKRAETYNTAVELIEILKQRQKYLQLFDCENSWKSKKDIDQSRNDQVKELFKYGFSTHHAGMLRKDRNLVESMFHKGDIKVLCSTSTLAWGVNLPAYAVLIKGTKVYDSSAGGYKDVGIFDVQQIFGRAGRPQFDKEGEAIILTPFKQMDEYVKMMQNKQKVESHLDKGLENCINAEIAAGQICTISEGVQWLKKSFYYRRMVQNPIGYAIKVNELNMDPSGHLILLQKVTECVQRLNRARLIRYNKATEQVYSTDMGRIASNYYINVETMASFMSNLKPHTQENMLLFHLAQATEFKQLDARKEEYEEMKQLCAENRYIEVDKACYNEAHTKVLCLIEAYLKKRTIKTFSLISDMAYVVQNSARLLRAMFEIALQKNYSELVKACLRWCQLLDKRLLPQAHLMRQFTVDCHVGKLSSANQNVSKYGYMKEETVYRLDQFQISMDDLYERKLEEAGRYISPSYQDEMYKFLSYVPYLDVQVDYQPITRTILKVMLTINADFCWNDRWNGNSEPFWIIVDNEAEILHQEHFMLQKKDVGRARTGIKNEDMLQLTFFIPYQVPEGYERIPVGTFYHLEILSDRWYGLEFSQIIELDGLAVPDEDYPMTKLLPLRPIPVTIFNDAAFETLYKDKFSFFNPIQTQVFHTLYHTDSNCLVGAPTGSGKTIISELAMLRVFKQTPKKKIIYIAPLKALAKERIIDWKNRLGNAIMKKSVLELTGDCTPDLQALKDADLLITTPEKWDGISRNWQHRSYVSDVALVVIDEIHLLGQDRGPVIEVIISRMRYIAEQTGNNVRFVGLSTALANAKDVADWLGIHKLGLFNFKPSVRPVPIKVFFEGFPEKHYCPRMATMNRPAFKAINTHAREHPVLVFVSSRRQTRLTALDLIALSAADQQEKMAESGEIDFKKPFLHMDAEEISMLSEYIKDENLRHTIQFGVGMHHAGLEESDRKIVEDLFVKKKIQILVTTSTLAWGVNFPARLVVVKGTEFFDPVKKRYVDFPLTDLLQMIGRAGRPGFDDSGVACVMVSEEKKNFYKKFLYEPFPVESSLANSLTDHLNAEIASGTLSNRKHCIDYLTWTYFFRRLTKNPAFYNVDVTDANGVNNYLKDLVNRTLKKLENAACVELSTDSDSITSTTLGYLASFYYLNHESIKCLSDALDKPQGIGELIDILSKAKEFAGLPVRHNEDILNEALSHLVPLKVPKHNLDSPHVKANLLLQAHFDRCPLPITDFVTDTKSVLDQSIRVLQAMIDVATHKGQLTNAVNLINLMQMLLQGQWLNQSPFLNLPNITSKRIEQLKQMGIIHLAQMLDNPANIPDVLKQLGMSKDEQLEAQKALERVPLVDMKWTLVAVDQRNEPIEDQLLEECGEAQLVVHLRRVNNSNNQNMLMSNFPKAKEAGWFIIVANPDTQEVICLKRVAFKKITQKKLIVVLPEDFDTPLQVILMCDSYIGLDQIYNIDLNKINEKIGASIKPTKAQPKSQQSQKVEIYDDYDDYKEQESSEDDGYRRYNKLYEMGIKSSVETALEKEDDDDDSFEFDVQAEDIYDLTVF